MRQDEGERQSCGWGKSQQQSLKPGSAEVRDPQKRPVPAKRSDDCNNSGEKKNANLIAVEIPFSQFV